MKSITTFALVLIAVIARAASVEMGMEAPALRQAQGRPEQSRGAVAPRLLSETGLYANAATLKIDPRNRPFSPQYPLWSDGASKRRWVRLPDGSQINVADLDKWQLPVGTKFWKEFTFKGRKVETRFLWRTRQDHWVFATYIWNDAQTEAELASESGVAGIAEIADGRRHSIPSVTECRSCHDSSRTEILGFNALQLSDDRDPNALHSETLAPDMITLKTLVDGNLVTPRRTDMLITPPRINAGSPITRTALGYLSANCGNCHNRESSIASLGLDLRYSSTAECSAIATAVGKRGHWVVPEAPEASRIINPGHPESSALLRRVKSRRPLSQMPPIGTVVVDRQAVELLTQWIQNNPDEWRDIVAKCATY